MLAYGASVLIDKMTDPKSAEGREMLELVCADARASKQFLLLAHLCAPSAQAVPAVALKTTRSARRPPQCNAPQAGLPALWCCRRCLCSGDGEHAQLAALPAACVQFSPFLRFVAFPPL